MPQHINSAYRVHSILSRAAGVYEGVTTLEAWAQVFRVTKSSSTHRNVTIVGMIGLLLEEVEDAYSKMKATNYSAHLYEEAFQNARSTLNIEHLNGAWGNFRLYLNAQTLQALNFSAELLPHEENLLNEEDLEQLSTKVEELRVAVAQGSLPDNVKAFVLSQIQIIENAIREYPVTGSKAFTQAVINAQANVVLNEEAVRQGADTEEFKTLGKIWHFIRERTTDWDTVQKLLPYLVEGAKALGSALGS